MKITFAVVSSLLTTLSLNASIVDVISPDGKLAVTIDQTGNGAITYSVKYDGKTILEPSPLGFIANVGDFSDSLTVKGHEINKISRDYTLNRSKKSNINYRANELKLNLSNIDNNPFTITFRVSDNDIALRYELPKMNNGSTGSIVIEKEDTGFDFPSETTVFLAPQSDAMIGWKRTKPSYEEVYQFDTPMTNKSAYGHGYTFPGLFKVGENGWVLISETGVDRRYCASRLSDMTSDGLYTVEFPMPEENNGNGTVAPAFALPGATPWRTITVGDNLAPIVETTTPWDNVEPRYNTDNDYQFGKGTWSWIVWQDNSINFEDQKKFIDLAADMEFKYTLIDCAWDKNIGREGIERLVDYARRKGVEIFLWYSSSGYWNDIVQSPINMMDSPIARKEEMRWMNKLGIKGIKVDFFGGDKQETMRLYEDILSDADDHGLMVIFHGCTLPRGWEMMYPNYVGSEAVLASENLIFDQYYCDEEAKNAALHPFCRNTVACMEFGGTFLNRRLSKGNKKGNMRKTTDGHELATAILFQNPIQNFAVTPENLLPETEGGAPTISIDFLRRVPTVWEDTKFIDGYPGKFVVIARKNNNKWYIAGTNAEEIVKKLNLDISRFVNPGSKVTLISDDKKTREPKIESITIKNPSKFPIEILPMGGFVIEVE
ncbi:MAG: glycoside hydrolase family 97 protein [Muribaculum sp.]|nr:glycoside hydrolase family 97 protein [Muribaculum sp.]